MPGRYEPPETIAMEGDRSQTATWLREVARTLGASRLPVVIVAEPGAGASALALAIHHDGGAGAGPYSSVHCADKAPEFFAHSELSPLCCPGTVVLEQIAELKPASQTALAALLDKGEIRARLLVVSGSELSEEARKGRLRRDLVERFGHFCVRIPPLRQRREDIVFMADRLLDRYARLYEKPKPLLSAALQGALEELPWPGNIPELDAMARMIVLLDDEKLRVAAVRSAAGGSQASAQSVPLKQASRAASRVVEREVIEQAMARNGGNRKQAARQLEISYKALLYKLKQLGLTEMPHREGA